MAMMIDTAQIVNALATKYGFREEEALAHLANEFLPMVALSERSDCNLTPEVEPKAKAKPAAKEPAKDAAKEAAKAAKEAAKAAKEAAKAAKEAKPKRPMTGKRLWEQSGVRKEVGDELKAAAEEGEKVGIGPVNQALTARWKALDETERALWDAKAADKSTSSSDSDSSKSASNLNTISEESDDD